LDENSTDERPSKRRSYDIRHISVNEVGSYFIKCGILLKNIDQQIELIESMQEEDWQEKIKELKKKKLFILNEQYNAFEE
jgi:hypothetical protein